MRTVQADQPFSFNYTAYDQNAGLFVAFSVYNVSSGTAVFVQKIVAAYSDFGAYMADFTGDAGVTYLVIGIVYTDNTYATVDDTRAPSSEVIHTQGGNLTFFGFDYASYDQDEGLFVQATIFNMSTGTPVEEDTVVMDHVAFGVYFGSSDGILTDTYQSTAVVYTDDDYDTVDTDRAPATSSFDCLAANSVDILAAAFVIGYAADQVNFNALPFGRLPAKPPVHFTQGDTVALILTAVDGNANPIDLTGAVIESFIRGPLGVNVDIPEDQHTINPDQVLFKGQFQLNLTETDTEACMQGEHKEILCKVTIGGSSVYFRGFNLLTVYAPVPFE